MCHWSPWKEGRTEEVSEETMTKGFSKFHENYKHRDPRSSTNPRHKEQEETGTEGPQYQIAQNQWQRENVQKRTQDTYGNKG